MTDEMIMEAVKNGDLQQASLLFERYHKRIYNFLARMASDRELADDLTQNVFLRMIRYRSSYKVGLKFQSWIYQMARNAFADHYRAHGNRNANFIDVEKISDRIQDPQEQEEQARREGLLQQSMELLEPDQRELLVMTRFQHMKYEEVAQILDTTVANIKVKVHRAIAKLREHYFQLEQN